MINKDHIINDFKKFRFVNSFEKNPSSDMLMFKQIKMNYDKNVYESKLFCYKNGETFRIRTQKKPIISKFYDDYSIIYVSKSEKQSKRFKSIISIQDISAKKSNQDFNIPFDISDLFVIDKYTILVLSNEKIDEDIDKEDFKQEIERINFVENGAGYTYNDVGRLYLYNLSTQKYNKISDDYHVLDVTVDYKAKKIYYIANRIKQIYSPFNKVYSYDIGLGDNVCLYDKDDVEFTYINSLDSEITVMASYQKDYGVNENIKLYRLKDNTLSLYADNKYGIGNSINSDIRYKTKGSIKKHKNALYFQLTKDEKCSIYKLENGNIELFFDNITSVDEYEFLQDELIVYGFDRQNIGEIYSYKNNLLKNITEFSQKFEKHINSYKVEEIEYNSNNSNMKGYILYPQNFDENKKYPAILCIHGGPKTLYSSNFIYEMYLLSKQGYFVFFTNPHGSDGKDNEFADIRGKYGTVDYDDLMNFTDIILQKYNAVDSSRLGVMGGSYGGYMTNCIIGKTDRFKVAVTQRCISNWISFYSTSDIGYYFATDQNGCNFDVQKLWEYSPLKNVKNIKTPTLIIHSDEDYRCPLEQAVQMFTHLKLNNIKTKLVIYKGENHDLSRTGKIKSRVSRLEQILKWFEQNL
ncbi:MAG: alpha/beta hydrolase family protein [Peptoanaerobacter stomatis]|uniref:alpha/beta hydrolase family protein n=1 Tax=Peptoanaerobacter stomatis TaxID=796937 RepID=UPI003FA047CF